MLRLRVTAGFLADADLELADASIFSADVFGQNEIEEMASNPAAQLTMLDRFQERASLAIAQELGELMHELAQSETHLRRLDQEIRELHAKASEVATLEE